MSTSEIAVRSRPILLLLAVATLLASALSAQNVRQELQDKNKKWLTCDVHFLSTAYTTRSDFTAKVELRGSPLAGVSLSLRKLAGVANTASAKTDSKGMAHFSTIPAGDYYLSVEQLLPNFAEVTVNPKRKDNDEIVFEWPNAPISARTLHGTLLAPRSNSPIENAQVDLIQLHTSRVIQRSYTDARGHYFLDAPVRGIYVLRFRPRADSKDHYDLGVDFSDESKSQELPVLGLESTDCGVFVNVPS